VAEAANQPGDEKKWTIYAPASEWLRGIARDAGLILDGFDHGIDADTVRHSKKRHGDAVSESRRGQIAITDADFECVPQVVGDPDRVVFGTQTKSKGLDAIGYVKRLHDGTIVHVEEVRRLDLLSREGTVETLNHLQRLTNYGVNYRSFTEQYLDSNGVFREAVVGILAAVAKQERVRLSERTITGLERAKAQGRVGGRPKAEDAEPKLVAQVARLRSQEHSIRAIAAELGKSPNTIMRLHKLEEASV
jgi:hypothetical protein